jgi:hypothetical protein
VATARMSWRKFMANLLRDGLREQRMVRNEFWTKGDET